MRRATAYRIDLHADMMAARIDAASLRRLARRALRAEAVEPPAELSIRLTGDATVQDLNRRFRRRNRPTDVLSFAQSEGEAFAMPKGAARHLGDVVISVETARRQAKEARVALHDEVAHLLVHGILHLLGYDHVRERDREVMRAREEAILGRAHHHVHAPQRKRPST